MPDPVYFYYAQNAPANAVPLARITAKAASPRDLVGINNSVPADSPLAPGAYTATGYPVARVHNGVRIGNPVLLHNSTIYLVQDQFFELTNVADATGNPLFYKHALPAGVTGASVLNLDGTPATGATLVRGNTLYHSFDGSAKWVQYYANRLLTTALLNYAPALTAGSKTSPTSYMYGHSVIEVNDMGNYWIRWTEDSGYRVLAPYNVLPNDPWYARIRFNPNPGTPEWAKQLFIPYRPYLAASWVPGKVLTSHVIEFERPKMLFDGRRYPDILVFDQTMKLKWAIDGSPVNSPATRGSLYPWRRAQYAPGGIDPYKARVNLLVDLEPSDICYGFYYYAEPDILYRAIDLNPFTNPAIAGASVQFVYNAGAADPYQLVYHRVLTPDGTPDTNQGSGNAPSGGQVFATVVVGDAVSPESFSFTDVRSPGGGLAPEFQSIDQANHFWDTGYLDGKPYPLGGAAAVFLPASLLSSYSRNDLQATVAAVLPMGSIPVVRFYDAQGNESV